MSGEFEGPDQDPKHISEPLADLLYKHLEPGVPVKSTINKFAADEHDDERREQKLAEEDPVLPTETVSQDEQTNRDEVLGEVERRRLEQLYRARREK